MSIKLRDVVSFAGRDYIVEGTASYLINGRTTVMARAVDGEVVLWIESPHAPGGGDRLMVLREVRDLELAVPPPESISYHDLTYVQRLVGRAQVDVAGSIPERTGGPVELWRYRAAGDLFLQIEAGVDRVFMLSGESVHQGMIDILPGR